jgi:hypothetical protein
MSETTDNTTSAATPTTSDEPTAAPTAGEGGAVASGGAGPEGGPVPGDPSTEPVATALQSHVAGRVGPPTIPQDSDAPWHAPDGVEQIAPGTVLPANTAAEGGALPVPPLPAELGAGPYGADTPADEQPNVVHATKPGTEGPTAAELPANTPLPGDKASASSLTGTGTGTTTTTAAPVSTSPTSPTGETASPSSSGSAVTAEPADSGSSGESGADEVTPDSPESTTKSTTTSTTKSKR